MCKKVFDIAGAEDMLHHDNAGYILAKTLH
jgi:hypothetical protein